MITRSVSCLLMEVRSGPPNRHALEAACEVAHALGLKLRSLFVEDEELTALAGLSCAREVSFSGRAAAGLNRQRLEQDMRSQWAAMRREIEAMASVLELAADFDTVRKEPDLAVTAACAEGALLVVTAPISTAEAARIGRLLEAIAGLSGLLLVGPKARRRSGPILVPVDDPGRIAEPLALAERLIGRERPRIVMLAIGETAAEAAAITAEISRLAAGRPPVEVVRTVVPPGAEADIVAGALQRLGGSLVVAQVSRFLCPGPAELRLYAGALECPMIILR